MSRDSGAGACQFCAAPAEYASPCEAFDRTRVVRTHLVALSYARVRRHLLFYPTPGPRNSRASISRKNILFPLSNILLVEHQLKQTAQRRRDKAIDCNTIAREYKRREEKEGERETTFLFLHNTLQKKSSVVITDRRTRGIGIKLQRNDISFFILLLFP